MRRPQALRTASAKGVRSLVAVARAKRACAAVALAGATIAVGGAFPTQAPQGVAEEAAASLAAAAFPEAAAAVEWIASGDAGSANYAEEAPEGFEDEVLEIPSETDARWDGGSCLVGFDQEGNASEVLEGVDEQLRGKGWSAAGAGGNGCATFEKGNGRYVWLFIACTQVGERTSVVVMYRTSEERD